jgi:mRNA interferase HigB
MKLLGRNRLQALYGLDDQTDIWLRSWVSEISDANWKHPKDVLRQFPQAKCITNGIFLFRPGLRTQYIEVSMMFPLAMAIVTDLKPIN